MKFVEFSEQYADGYRHFLKQIAQASAATSGMPFSYYLPSPDISIERHLVVDETCDRVIVVGAVDIKLQNYSVAGETVRVGVVKYPVSLGIVDPRYATVGVYIFTKLAQIYPLNFLLGMGRPEVSRIAQLVEMMGWTLNPIPYFLLPLKLAPLVQEAVAGYALLASVARVAAALRCTASTGQRHSDGRPAGGVHRQQGGWGAGQPEETDDYALVGFDGQGRGRLLPG